MLPLHQSPSAAGIVGDDVAMVAAAGVVELADTPALGAGAARLGGSSPSARIRSPQRPGAIRSGACGRPTSRSLCPPVVRGVGEAVDVLEAHGAPFDVEVEQDERDGREGPPVWPRRRASAALRSAAARRRAAAAPLRLAARASTRALARRIGRGAAAPGQPPAALGLDAVARDGFGSARARRSCSPCRQRAGHAPRVPRGLLALAAQTSTQRGSVDATRALHWAAINGRTRTLVPAVAGPTARRRQPHRTVRVSSSSYGSRPSASTRQSTLIRSGSMTSLPRRLGTELGWS